MVAELSIIVVNWNAKDALRKCLKSIYNTVNIPPEIIIIDNNSSDESASMIKTEFPNVLLLKQKKNLGFSKASNIGFKFSKGKYILFLNPDVILLKDSVNKMVKFLDIHPQAGIIGPKILREDGTIDFYQKRRFPTNFHHFLEIFLIKKLIDWSKKKLLAKKKKPCYKKTGKCESLVGCCMLMKRETFTLMEGFDEQVPMYLDDIDICFRCREKGLDNFYLEEAKIIHIGQHSTKKARNYKMYDVLNIQAHKVFYRKHYSRMTVLLYSFIILLAIPYLLILDIISFPYFVFLGRFNERLWVIKKHLRYIEVVLSDKIIKYF